MPLQKKYTTINTRFCRKKYAEVLR